MPQSIISIDPSVQKPKLKGKANLAFVIDVTGSMTPCLENLKKNLIELSQKINDIAKSDFNAAEPEISYNVLGFRDLAEDQASQIVLMNKDFTPDLGVIEKFFEEKQMMAAGGGDEPESALDAIVISATQFNWDKAARVMVLFTDASTKITLHPTTVEGHKLSPEQSISRVMSSLAENKIRLIIFGPNDVEEFQRIALQDQCFYVPMEKAGETLASFKDQTLFKDHVIKAIARTVGQSSSTPVWNG